MEKLKAQREAVRKFKMDEPNFGLGIFILSIWPLGALSVLVAGIMQKDDEAKTAGITIGIVYWVLSFFLVGWILAIIDCH